MGSQIGNVVGFLGFDELSLEMAASLLRSGYKIQAFRVEKALTAEFLSLGGMSCASPLETVKDAAALVVSVSREDQVDAVLGQNGVLQGLQHGAVIILRSPIQPTYIRNLEKSLNDNGVAASLVEAYVSRGKSERLNGRIMISASGSAESIASARPILSAMSEKLYLFDGEVGAASKVKMVDDLLEGIHFVASVEAMSLAAMVGIHPWMVYEIILTAAGNSWAFKNYVPQLLREELKPHSLNSLVENLGTVMDGAKSHIFPLPLASVAHQELIFGSSSRRGEDNEVPFVKVWERLLGLNIQEAASAESYSPEQLAHEITAKSPAVKRVGFIGLGAMGFGMATSLLRSNVCVVGYDVYKPSLTRFADAGGLVGNSPAEVSKDADVLVIMVINEAQAESILYGDQGAVAALPRGAAIILSSTVSPGFASKLEQRLQNEGKDLKLVDAPVSGGFKRAAEGTLTIMASGTTEALTSCGSVLAAFSEKLFLIKGGCGAASGVKMVNQLLCGVHIATAAEAMAYGARLGVNQRMLFDFVTNSVGTSWIFENRVPHLLDNDYTPYSALDILVKDLGIIYRECSSHKVPLHLATAAHQLFFAGSAAGWGRQSDAGVVRVYESLTGVKVEGKVPIVQKEDVVQSLPPQSPRNAIDHLRKLCQSNSKTLVVLDDDSTGNQIVDGAEVLKEWSVESLIEVFKKKPTSLSILTNSRSLSSEKASALIKDICTNLSTAAKSLDNVDYTVVLRGDSTLRGQFPDVKTVALK